MSRGTARITLKITINSDTYSKCWYIVVGVTIPIEGLQRGQSIIMTNLLFRLLDRKTWTENRSHGTVPLKLNFMTDNDTYYKITINSDTYSKCWYIVVGVTIPIEGLQRGQSIIMTNLLFRLLDRKTWTENRSHGTVPLKLNVMTDNDTYYKYCYIVVGVTIPFKGSQRVLSKIILNFLLTTG